MWANPTQAKIPCLTNRDVQKWSPLLCPHCYHGLMVSPVWEGHRIRFSDTGNKTREELCWETAAVNTPPNQAPLHWGSTGSRPMGSSAVAFPWGWNSLALFILAHTEGISLYAIPIHHCTEQKKKKTEMNGINLMFQIWYLTGLSLPVCQCQPWFSCINQLWFFPGC